MMMMMKTTTTGYPLLFLFLLLWTMTTSCSAFQLNKHRPSSSWSRKQQSHPPPPLGVLAAALVATTELPSLMDHLETDNRGSTATTTLQQQEISSSFSFLWNMFDEPAWLRATEIGSVVCNTVLFPVLFSLVSSPLSSDWNEFWNRKTTTIGGSGDELSLSHAERVTLALERLGCTYVKFGQALASRPDIIPPPLAHALSKLQDCMEPFDNELAKTIIRKDLLEKNMSNDVVQTFMDSLSVEPVAAASIGQVYKARLPNGRAVAVKVQRPGIKETVQRDAQLLRAVAQWIESLPSIRAAIPGHGQDDKQKLVQTKLVNAVDEFMARVFEELDYRNEADNMETFARLYCNRSTGSNKRSSSIVKVVVPQLIREWSTDRMLVMEWIDGTKLATDFDTYSTETTVENSNSKTPPPSSSSSLLLAENLALIHTGIECTLSQLLDTGTLHADPHLGNLVKVVSSTTTTTNTDTNTRKTIKNNNQNAVVELGYLDFGILSTVPETVRDGLVCAVVQLVFCRNASAVADLFADLQMLPRRVLQDPTKRAALAVRLDEMFDNVLEYPLAPVRDNASRDGNDENDKRISSTTTPVPILRFDNLLGSLTGLVSQFEFTLPPYFLNNARALGTLEGVARKLDPTFNVLRTLYPYALNRLLTNPSKSKVVEQTLLDLMRCPQTNKSFDRVRIAKLLRDSAALTGYSRRKVLLDIAKTRGGKRMIGKVALGMIQSRLLEFRGSSRRRDSLLDKAIYLRL